VINPKQLRDLITRTLKEIPHGYSEDAVELLMMIAAHESRLGTYLRQVGGPALGIFQMEPATHDDVWENGDSCEDNGAVLGYNLECTIGGDMLEYDLRYQIFMARQKLFMISEPLPSSEGASSENVSLMSDYCKEYWNTVDGSADAFEYFNAYLDYCGE
jgi:hypothetical protein